MGNKQISKIFTPIAWAVLGGVVSFVLVYVGPDIHGIRTWTDLPPMCEVWNDWWSLVPCTDFEYFIDMNPLGIVWYFSASIAIKLALIISSWRLLVYFEIFDKCRKLFKKI